MADQEYETWEARGRVVLRRLNHTGASESVLVNRGRRIQLTERERLMNQDGIADEKLDPFANGTLSPVRIPESSTTAQALVTNPNTISEEEMVKLLDGHHKTFEKRLSEITSPYVVRRMMSLAQEGNVDITVKRVEALETRLRELSSDDVPVTVNEKVQPGQ